MPEPGTSGPQFIGLTIVRPLGSGPWSPWLVKGDDQTWLVARPGAAAADLPDHPALLPLQGVVADASGQSWTLIPYVSGLGLDRRNERIGAMRLPEASACLAPIAGAVACLHQSGLHHGDLVPSRILLGRADTTVLDASCAAPLGPGDAQADVAALAGLFIQLLGDSAPAPGWLADADAGTMDADGFARQLTTLASVGSRRTRRWRGLARSALVLGASGAVVAVAGLLGVAFAERGPAPSSLAPPVLAAASPIAPRISAEQAEHGRGLVWAHVIRALDDSRSQMLATGDAGLLSRVAEFGSAAFRHDQSMLRGLRSRGLVAIDWRPSLRSVRPLNAESRRVALEVVDTLPNYWLQSSDGTHRHRVGGRGERRWTIQLVRAADGWVISAVERSRLQD